MRKVNFNLAPLYHQAKARVTKANKKDWSWQTTRRAQAIPRPILYRFVRRLPVSAAAFFSRSPLRAVRHNSSRFSSTVFRSFKVSLPLLPIVDWLICEYICKLWCKTECFHVIFVIINVFYVCLYHAVSAAPMAPIFGADIFILSRLTENSDFSFKYLAYAGLK